MISRILYVSSLDETLYESWEYLEVCYTFNFSGANTPVIIINIILLSLVMSSNFYIDVLGSTTMLTRKERGLCLTFLLYILNNLLMHNMLKWKRILSYGLVNIEGTTSNSFVIIIILTLSFR